MSLFWLYLGCAAALAVAFWLVYRKEVRRADRRERIRCIVERLEREKQAQEIAEMPWARN